MRETLDRALKVATDTLTPGRAVLERGEKLLLEKETLTEGELQTLRSELLAAPTPDHPIPVVLASES